MNDRPYDPDPLYVGADPVDEPPERLHPVRDFAVALVAAAVILAIAAWLGVGGPR